MTNDFDIPRHANSRSRARQSRALRVVLALLEDFEAHRPEIVARLRRNYLTAYMGQISRLLAPLRLRRLAVFSGAGRPASLPLAGRIHRAAIEVGESRRNNARPSAERRKAVAPGTCRTSPPGPLRGRSPPGSTSVCRSRAAACGGGSSPP